MATGKGGKRPGAGRKPSSVTKATRKRAEEALTSGLLQPLDFFLQILRTEPDDSMSPADKAALFERRLDAAKAAAPFVHAKLASVTSNSTVQGQITLVSDFPS